MSHRRKIARDGDPRTGALLPESQKPTLQTWDQIIQGFMSGAFGALIVQGNRT
jgi:hypothetical protein